MSPSFIPNPQRPSCSCHSQLPMNWTIFLHRCFPPTHRGLQSSWPSHGTHLTTPEWSLPPFSRHFCSLPLFFVAIRRLVFSTAELLSSSLSSPSSSICDSSIDVFVVACCSLLSNCWIRLSLPPRRPFLTRLPSNLAVSASRQLHQSLPSASCCCSHSCYWPPRQVSTPFLRHVKMSATSAHHAVCSPIAERCVASCSSLSLAIGLFLGPALTLQSAVPSTPLPSSSVTAHSPSSRRFNCCSAQLSLLHVQLNDCAISIVSNVRFFVQHHSLHDLSH